MRIDWHQFKAAIWRSQSQQLKPIKRLDKICLDSLLGIDKQKQAIKENTRHFLGNKTANHALLWGARGTGKSSLIKAILNEFSEEGLRMIQLDKDDLPWLPEILDSLESEDEQFHFVIVCDDLSFESGETSYKPLKTLLEGGLELPPSNVLLYATSNRRHLLPEKQSENQLSKVIDGEVHFADSLEEKLALSDRFGLTLPFYPAGWEHYYDIVDMLLADLTIIDETVHQAAKTYAMNRGNHSGRTAKHFVQYYRAKLNK